MLTLLFASLLFLLPARAFASGADALPFLKIDTGARAASLGGAYCAAGGDAAGVFYNPAGPALAARKEFAVSHNQWLQGLRHESLAYLQPVSGAYTAFGGANLLLSGSMDKYDSAGARTGSFNSQEGAFGLGLAAGFGGGFYGGAALKVLYQKADKYGGGAFAGDAGLLKVFRNLRFGASASNLGSAMKSGSGSFALPLMLRAGAGARLDEQFQIFADVLKAGGSPAALCAGVEGEFIIGENEEFFARAGYKNGRSLNTGSGFTAGVGIKNNTLRLDYAFVPYGDIGDAHRVTLSFSFGAPRGELPAVNRRGYQRRQPASKKRKQTKTKTEDSAIPLMW